VNCRLKKLNVKGLEPISQQRLLNQSENILNEAVKYGE
jgi:hypothetical protein